VLAHANAVWLSIRAGGAGKAPHIKQQSIGQLEAGKVKSPRYVIELAESLNVSLEWLRHGKGQIRFSQTAPGASKGPESPTFEAPVGPTKGVAKIATRRAFFDLNGESYFLAPVYDARASAGPGALNAETPEPLFDNVFRKDWAKAATAAEPEDLAVLRVSGDSMWDTLHDGNHILVDRTTRRWVLDGLYVIRHSNEDELMVKRLVCHPSSGLLIVKNDDGNYGPQLSLPDEAIAIEGRVIWLERNLG
jgi:phage repressor protein C with HTH and peptisase S24 domain